MAEAEAFLPFRSPSMYPLLPNPPRQSMAAHPQPESPPRRLGSTSEDLPYYDIHVTRPPQRQIFVDVMNEARYPFVCHPASFD